MYTEELIEDGIVTEVKNGIATVSVINSESCEECSAKIFCHTENNVRNVTAKDPYGVKAGDKVQISIKGRNVVAASFLLYGLPLIILVAVILIGTAIIKNNSELYSSLAGIAVVGIYFLGVHLLSNSQRRKNKFLPKIIFVSQEKSHLSI
jgi:sigma-E factor negative regulatory protein RseC